MASLTTMSELVDYSLAADVYEKGRVLSAEDLGRWKAAVGNYVEPSQTSVLDLGAGTGIFTRAWSSWRARRVIACEPSSAMRREATRAGWPPGAALVAGRAEQIPVLAGVADVVWLSTVVHHISDRYAWAAETARVLKRGGWLMIRNQFAELGTTPWADELPGAARAQQVFPRLAELAALLAPHGLELVGAVEVTESSRDHSPQAVAAWIRRMRHADSLLLRFTDDEIDVGLDRLDRYPSTHRLGPLKVGLAAFRAATGGSDKPLPGPSGAYDEPRCRAEAGSPDRVRRLFAPRDNKEASF
jgi:ubiquinone/menaquinone biosynthesis C-methylase UbiE